MGKYIFLNAMIWNLGLIFTGLYLTIKLNDPWCLLVLILYRSLNAASNEEAEAENEER